MLLWNIKDGILEGNGDVNDKYYHYIGYSYGDDDAEIFDTVNRGIGNGEVDPLYHFCYILTCI